MNDIKLISLPKINDYRGNLSFFENNNQIPFKIRSTQLIYSFDESKNKFNHAFKETKEFILALSGSFYVILNDGNKERKFHLNKSSLGLYIPNKVWIHLYNFSKDCVTLRVSSKYYDESDCIKNFNEFKISLDESK